MYEFLRDILDLIQTSATFRACIEVLLILIPILLAGIRPCREIIQSFYEDLGFSEETAENLSYWTMGLLFAPIIKDILESDWPTTSESNSIIFLGTIAAIAAYIIQLISESLKRNHSDIDSNQIEDLSEPENKTYSLDTLLLPMIVLGSLSFDNINTDLKIIDPEYLILVFKSWIPTLAELIQLGLI